MSLEPSEGIAFKCRSLRDMDLLERRVRADILSRNWNAPDIRVWRINALGFYLPYALTGWEVDFMSENPPYMNAYGLIPKILKKIKEAPQPNRFTGDFLSTKLGFSGGSARAFLPFAKRIGLIGAEGAPTELYARFRNPSQSGRAIAEAMRIGYKTLYERNEYAQDLTTDKLEGLIMEATGLPKGTAVRAILNSFVALKKEASFDKSEEAEAKPSEREEEAKKRRGTEGAQGLPPGVHLSYTINLNLPETTDVAVFNAIFKSLKEHLLQG